MCNGEDKQSRVGRDILSALVFLSRGSQRLIRFIAARRNCDRSNRRRRVSPFASSRVTRLSSPLVQRRSLISEESLRNRECLSRVPFNLDSSNRSRLSSNRSLRGPRPRRLFLNNAFTLAFLRTSLHETFTSALTHRVSQPCSSSFPMTTNHAVPSWILSRYTIFFPFTRRVFTVLALNFTEGRCTSHFRSIYLPLFFTNTISQNVKDREASREL